MTRESYAPPAIPRLQGSKGGIVFFSSPSRFFELRNHISFVFSFFFNEREVAIFLWNFWKRNSFRGRLRIKLFFREGFN